MTFTIRNGRRADVEFGPFTGRAGVSEDGDEVAFPGDVARMRNVSSGTIDGVEHEVLSIAKSTVKGMVVLAVRMVTGA